MFRLRIVAPLTAILALALTSVAFASVSKIIGGSTKIALSPAAAKVLSNHHITATVTGVSGGYVDPLGTALTFPITGGHVNTKTLVGVVRHQGSLVLSNGKRSVALRKLTILSFRHSAELFAELKVKVRTICRPITRRHPHASCVTIVRSRSARVADITNITRSGASATGTLKVTRVTTDVVNDLAGKSVVKPGAVFGTATVTSILK